MDLPRKNGSGFRPTLEFATRMPAVPQDTLERFPSLAKWQSDLEKWWFDLRQVLQRRDQDMDTTKLQESVNSLKASIASLSTQAQSIVTQISNTDLSVLTARVVSLEANVAILLARPRVAAGAFPISSGADSVTVSGQGWGAIPLCVYGLSVIAPPNGEMLFASLVAGTVTADGFKATINGITDSADYQLAFACLLA